MGAELQRFFGSVKMLPLAVLLSCSHPLSFRVTTNPNLRQGESVERHLYQGMTNILSGDYDEG